MGEDDALIDAAQQAEIGGALRAAGTDHEIVSYPGTAHAFFWAGTPAFNQTARDDAWSRILAMLEEVKQAPVLDHGGGWGDGRPEDCGTFRLIGNSSVL